MKRREALRRILVGVAGLAGGLVTLSSSKGRTPGLTGLVEDSPTFRNLEGDTFTAYARQYHELTVLRRP